MLRALLRYLLFEVPVGFLKGLAFIIFDKDEIVGTHFTVEDQKNKAEDADKAAKIQQNAQTEETPEQK